MSKGDKNKLSRYIYQLMMVSIVVFTISFLAISDHLSGKETSTLLGSTIGYVLGKFL